LAFQELATVDSRSTLAVDTSSGVDGFLLQITSFGGALGVGFLRLQELIILIKLDVFEESFDTASSGNLFDMVSNQYFRRP
jgi:hypothetical protein